MFTNWASIVTQPQSGAAGTIIKPPAPFQGPKVFPRYTSTPDASVTSFTPPAEYKSFYSYIQRIKKATDVTTSHLNALGVSVEYDFPVEKMLPEGDWFPAEDDKTFSERKKELLIANNDAFDVLSRRNKTIRLGHMYRFFQAMELLKPYYPTAPVPSDVASSQSDSEEKSEQGSGKRKAEEEVEGGVEKKGRASEESAESDASVSEEDKKDGKKEKPEKFSMPEKFREELVKNFIEPICWGYGVRVYAPRAPPIVCLQKSKFLVHLTNYIYLTPKLPAEARAGLVEGPVMGMQVRHETRFRSAAYEAARKKMKTTATVSRRIDILEVGQLGVDKMDIDDEKDKDKDDDDDEDDTMLADDVIGIAREVAATLSIAQDRRKGPRPGKEGKTEKKVRYRAIGKEEKYRDDIFIMTSLHHHVSISHVSVSQPYLRYLETGKMPDFKHEFFQTKEGKDWDRLKIQKTRFWDLLDPQERVEACYAFCGVQNWLSREETKR
ncbi:uncharacterized protein LAJ45_02485 [Morchella importuna]|uniref:Uncharacterized protein n=1 Tax=Morchella conica CCBAS932 TaxID=1392247 RepID=A0A3N4KWC0_9PEZI|nr:uncharacterized protein LAJ45_02485 [Morchella importuna]KAH8153672.1 hypothetical protein LAJ45_02485 [Morchella importuna]RPB14827.1 hypothetical protein P167DRAFT_563539 [Morchella conica CCBAS932]